LKIHRGKLAQALGTLPPDKVDDRGSSRWLMARVVQHLTNQATGSKKLNRNDEDARRLKAQADKLEMEMDLARGEIVKTEDVGEYVLGILMAFRSKLLAMPKRLAPRLTGMKRTGDVQAMIETDITAALAELAALDPEAMLKEVRGTYIQKEDQPGDGDDET